MANGAIVAFKKEIKAILLILGVSLAIIWSVFLVNSIVFGMRLNQFGIHPRTLHGLFAIFSSPFLHGSFFHILNNSISFCLFGTLILISDIRRFFAVTIISGIVSGLGIWLFGSSATNHIGASGIILGYFGYCVSVGFIEKRIGTLLFSVLIILQYGGMFFSIFPGRIGISWEGHLFGFIGGILAAMALKHWRNKS